MKQLKQLRQAFPKQAIVELNNGTGCNIHFDKATISVWFKKKKYGNSDGWSKYKDISDFIAEMDKYITPQPKVAYIEPQPVETDDLIAMFQAHNKERGEIAKEQLDAYCDFKSKHGVQDCINHILKKRDFIMQNQPDNKLAAFCQTLIDELQQYL